MNLIGGAMLRGPIARGDADALLRSMAARVPNAGELASLTSARVAVFTTGSAQSHETSDAILVAADVDLVNLDELAAAAGLRDLDPVRVIASLYAHEGPRCIQRLRGGFAVAIWDQRHHRLHLAIDHHGIKRLYYVTSPSGLAFASRGAALLAFPGVDPAVDATAVYHSLNFGFVPAPGSVFRGVRRLPPGHELAASTDRLSVTRYWDPVFTERPIAAREAAAATYRLVEDAVASCLRGSSPKETGAFLSGGTDSSTVVGLMGKVSAERVNAFSVGFREPRYDEMAYAELAARHFNAAHYTVVVGADQAFAALPRLVEAYDEPFGNSSALGTFFCAQLARDSGVTRLLAGDGGDEVFGGNERYAKDRIFGLYHRLPKIVRRGLLEPFLQRLPEEPRGVLGRAQRYVRRANLGNPDRFYFSEFFFAREATRLLSPDFLAAVDPEAPWRVLRDHFGRARATSELNRLLYLDLKLTIGDNDLLKVTRTAELAGVAVRFPMLDLPLVELWGTLPARFKVRGLEKRHLFKRAFRTLLPKETLAKRKHGFGVPTGWWVKTDPTFHAFTRDTLLSRRSLERGYFRPHAIEHLFELLAADPTPYYGDLLWNVLMLELWQQRHLDSRGQP